MGTAGLRDGMKADLVVFNPDTVRATATFEDPKQFPVGIDHVLVNGQPVIHNGGAHGGVASGEGVAPGVAGVESSDGGASQTGFQGFHTVCICGDFFRIWFL